MVRLSVTIPLISLLLLNCIPVFAQERIEPLAGELIVLGKSAEARSLAELYPREAGRLTRSIGEPDFSKLVPRAPNVSALQSAIVEVMGNPEFPITTTLKLSPASATAYVDKLLVRPFCLIGADEISKQWLTGNLAALVEANAFCVIVQAQDAQDVAMLRALALPLRLATIPMDEPLRKVGVNQYPVFISTDNRPGKGG